MVSFNLKDFLEDIFKVEALRDSDGIYHYLIQEKNDSVNIGVTDKISDTDLANKIVLEFDRSNSISITYYNDNNKLIDIEVMEIQDAKYIVDYSALGSEETIQLYSADMTGRYVELSLKPHLKLSLRVKY